MTRAKAKGDGGRPAPAPANDSPFRKDLREMEANNQKFFGPGGLHEVDGKLWAGDRPVLKGWESFKGWFWFGVERAADGTWYGLVQGFEEEWGYFSEAEMAPLVRAGRIWPIKRCDLPHAGRRVR
jgi:hypothetical protein